MTNAVRSTRRGNATRLLVLAGNQWEHRTVGEMPEILKSGDVLVVNDAATLPSSLFGTVRLNSGAEAEIEIRLLQPLSLSRTGEFPKQWRTVLFGKGDWRTPTEKRPAPPKIVAGAVLHFKKDLQALVTAVEEKISERLLHVEFLGGDGLWDAFYSQAHPIQYSYLRDDLQIWDQQTIFAGPPVALEPPSASFPFTWELIDKLEKNGIEVLKITHATGISNTGDPRIDRLLPITERSTISNDVRAKILAVKKEGRRIVALGTGVARALESWDGTMNEVESFETDLKITENHRLKFVTALITGLHEPEASHLRLLASFAPGQLIRDAYADASKKGYLWHEYGDLCLVLPRANEGLKINLFDRR